MGMLTVKYPETIYCSVTAHVLNDDSTGDTTVTTGIICLEPRDDETDNLIDCCEFIQTEELSGLGVGVHSYGAIVYTLSENAEDGNYLYLKYKGKLYKSEAKLRTALRPCEIENFTFTPVEDGDDDPSGPDDPIG